MVLRQDIIIEADKGVARGEGQSKNHLFRIYFKESHHRVHVVFKFLSKVFCTLKNGHQFEFI